MKTPRTILSSAAAALAVTLAMPAVAQAPSAAEAAFKRADANGDGKLTKEEAARLPAIAAKFEELDKDKDGALSMSEFTAGYEAPK
jgi:EF hand